MKYALLVIDMQNGFLNPESSLCIRGARATVPACARLIAGCCSSNTEEIQAANLRDMANVGAEIRESGEFLEQLADEAVPLVIRPARPEDAQRCAAIEAACFPPEQAASLQATIEDEMFADVGCHSGENPYQSVFSLAVHPDFQCRGYGRLLLNALIQQARREHRLAVTLTCREHKIAYYESFGFKNLGLAASVHGGVPWYDMYLPLEEGSPA